nr:hypothetical protein [Tanacetum cinerariifolium]
MLRGRLLASFQDLEHKGGDTRSLSETATPSIIVHSESKSKDKGKGILVEELKPLKKQAQIKQDEAYAREKNMMVYLKNMAGFKMDFFKAKKQKLDEEVEELKTHLQIVPNNEDDVYTGATPLALKVPVVDYQIHTENNKPYYKIIRADMILLVERRYPLIRFTLDQMLDDVRLEIEEESEVSLELLRFVRRQEQAGYRPYFGVDVVEDFKEYTLRDYYCWLKTYCCWYKLKLLDNVADTKLRLLEESAAADDKMKK